MSMSNFPSYDFLDELAGLCARRVDVRALVRDFCDNGRIIARAEIDETATMRAGHLVVNCQPSDSFRRSLATLLATDSKGHSLTSSHVSTPKG